MSSQRRAITVGPAKGSAPCDRDSRGLATAAGSLPPALNSLSRRGTFGIAAGLAALLAPFATAAATPSPDAGLIRLARAYEQEQHAWNAAGDHGQDDDHPIAVAADQERDRISARQDVMLARLLAMTPTTLDGLGAIAGALVAWDLEMLTPHASHDDGHRMTAHLVGALLAITGQAEKAQPRRLPPPVPFVVQPYADPDAELIAAVEDYIALTQHTRAAYDASALEQKQALSWARVQADRRGELSPEEVAAHKVAALPATTPAGRAAKARALNWFYGGTDERSVLDRGADVLLNSLLVDLRGGAA